MTTTNKRRQITSVQDLLLKGPLNVGSYFKLSPGRKETCYNTFYLHILEKSAFYVKAFVL
jgi:hypothetical protein